MAIRWMWGFESGVNYTTYQASAWDLSRAGLTNELRMSYPDPFQPAAGYGGGNYCLAMGGNNAPHAQTPTSGKNSIGVHSRFIFHMAFKRIGNTNVNPARRIFAFRSAGGTVEEISLRHTIANTGTSAVDLYINDAYVATSTTTYTSAQPYLRIVLDADGVTGHYTVYVNGVVEIQDLSGTRFIDPVDTLRIHSGGTDAISNGGGRYDHLIIWDGGDHATNDLVVDVLPNNGDTVTIGAQTYTWRTTLTPAANEVLIDGGASLVVTRQNLMNAINLGPGSGTAYAAATTLNVDVRAEEDLAAGSVHLIAKTNGTGLGLYL